MKDVTITFNASGWVTQTLRVDDDVDADDLAAGLEKGEYFTTIETGGEVIDKDGRQVGVVDYVDAELEYSEFELQGAINERLAEMRAEARDVLGG